MGPLLQLGSLIPAGIKRGLLVYGAFGVATGFICRTQDVVINIWFAAFLPLIPFGLGMVVGARPGDASEQVVVREPAQEWIEFFAADAEPVAAQGHHRRGMGDDRGAPFNRVDLG